MAIRLCLLAMEQEARRTLGRPEPRRAIVSPLKIPSHMLLYHTFRHTVTAEQLH